MLQMLVSDRWEIWSEADDERGEQVYSHKVFLRYGVMPPERRTDPKPASLIQALEQRIGDAKILKT